MVDQPSSAIANLETPVGFVYVDGGKVRWANEPMYSLLEERMMVRTQSSLTHFRFMR